MSHLRHIVTPEGVAAPFAHGYSQVVAASGRLVVVSGQIAFDESGAVVGVGDPALQAEQAFENVRRCLAAAGATFDDVVKLTYYVTDISYLAEVRAVRDRLFSVLNPESPARTFERITSIRQRERKRSQIEHMTAKLVSLLGLSGNGILRNQIQLVGLVPCSESFQGTLRIDVFYAYTRKSSRRLFDAHLRIRPKGQ